MKKFIKYISRIALGAITLFWCLCIYKGLNPKHEYPCGTSDFMLFFMGSIFTMASLILFCIVWYITKKW